MRHVSILAAAMLLSGCGIPPVVAIASYAVDGALLVATGKTSKDHALSLAMQQDCNMLRIVVGDQICHDYEPTNRARWALAAMPANEEHLVTVRDGRVIRVAASPDADDPSVVVATTGPAPLPAAPPAASLD
jgi:hypothetical protein